MSEASDPSSGGSRLWSITLGGVAGGAAGGWISATVLVFCVRHAFQSEVSSAFVWGGRIAAWYALLGLGVGIVAAAVSILPFVRGITSLSAILRSARSVAVLGLGTALLLTFGLVLNFSMLPRPIEPNVLRIAVNVMVVLAGGAVLYLTALALVRSDRRVTPPVWSLAFPAAAALAWILPLVPDPRLIPERFIAGDDNACPVDAATQLAKTHSGPRPNLVLVTVDTLRADHLTPYGYPRATSPFLAGLATEAALFERTFATKASTSTAIASFHTSRLPWAHGVSHPYEVLPEDNLTIAEVLQAAGYETGAVVQNGNVFPLFRYNQGFDDYEYGAFGAAELSDRAISWLSRRSDKPYFLWIHYVDPHSPYAPPPSYASLFVDDPYYVDDPLTGPYPDTFRGATAIDPAHDQRHHLNKSWYLAQYDGEIRYTDDQIARVHEKLQSLGRTGDAWFVVSADHGECFGEQEYFGHGELAHDCGLHVPLIVRPPGGIRGRRIAGVASMIDLAPTLLDVMGFGKSPCFQGRSWSSDLMPESEPPAGRNESVPALATAGFITHVHGGHRFVLRNQRWKFVRRNLEWMFDLRSPKSVFWLWNSLSEGGLADDELYDLRADPQETQNLIRRDVAQAESLAAELTVWLGKTGPRHAPATRLSSRRLDEVAPDILESLKVLGYIQ